MRRALLLALPAAALFAPAPAAAQCVPSGGVVTCTGSDTVGIDDATDGLTVEVAPGADVTTTTADAVRVDGDGVTVNNAGTIEAQGAGDEAIQTNGDGLTVNNAGVIDAADYGIDAEPSANVTLNNAGTITSGNEALRADGGGLTVVNSGTISGGVGGAERAIRGRGFGTTVANLAGGVITSTDETIEGRDGFALTNDGTIVGDDDAVQFGDGTLTNNAGGVIRSTAVSDGDGIDVDSGLIRNFGLIQALSGAPGAAAIDIDPDAESGLPAPLLRIENSGEIDGFIGILADPARTGGVEIVNSGLISGRGGVAVELGGGDDLLELSGMGALDGSALLGGGDDVLSFGPGALSGDLAGGGVFDGGTGANTVVFALPGGLGALTRFALTGGGIELAFGAADGGVSTATLRNFQSFVANGETWTAEQVAARVPLPAAAPALLGGLVALGWMARRRRRAA